MGPLADVEGSPMTRWLACGLGLLLGCASVSAQSSGWGTPDEPSRAASEWAGSAPAATLGIPRAMSQAPDQTSPAPDTAIRPAAFADGPPASGALIRPDAQDFDVPPPFRPQELEPRLPRSSFRTDGERFAPHDPPGYRVSDDRPSRRTSYSDWPDISQAPDAFRRRDGMFASDHCFDFFASPVTNPFLFEDPRALTEIRPIFTWQSIPSNNPVFKGGNAEFFGTQLRLALTDRLSFTVNKLGVVAINPGSGSTIPSGFGFAEIDLGPKFTFLRSEATKALGAAGVIFQIPAGSAEVFQNTGSLSIVPYISLAKNFFETRLGSLNVMDTFGYSFSTTRARTDYFYNSIHLDWDIMNEHRFYPFVELNWFYYSVSGDTHHFGTEGRDLANLGSTDVGGRNNVHIAPGIRFQFSRRTSVGVAVEIPLSDRRDMLNYRGTLDVIFRY
jgi:hypothetical protein